MVKECTVALAFPFPLLLRLPLLLCQNVGGNGKEDDNNNCSGGSSSNSNGNNDNLGNSSCVGGCAPLLFCDEAHSQRCCNKKLANNGKVGITKKVFSRPTNLLHLIKENL